MLIYNMGANSQMVQIIKTKNMHKYRSMVAIVQIEQKI